MDLTTLLILGGLALAIVVAALWALRRAWGDFPSRAGELPPAGMAAPGMSSRPAAPPLDTGDAPATDPAPALVGPATAPTGLVPIEHPMVLRAARAAIQRDDRAARYIVRDGDKLYFAFGQIADPVERQAAYDLMRRFNAGEDVDIRAMMRLAQQMFKT
ncbi:MAG: hypothetical protein ACJ8CR_15370 [Roseiflexaceae bacterium]